jgi:NAD+ kinase
VTDADASAVDPSPVDPGPVDPAEVRRVLMLIHTGREEARDVALACAKSLAVHGIVVRMLAREAGDLGIDPGA